METNKDYLKQLLNDLEMKIEQLDYYFYILKQPLVDNEIYDLLSKSFNELKISDNYVFKGTENTVQDADFSVTRQ